MANGRATFLTGSTMRHVVVMTMTGMLGLTFMFLVDAVTLFWVSRLGVEANIAAMGFAWTVQFFSISVSIGFMIAAVALISRSLGQGRLEDARRQVTTSAILTVGIQIVLSALLFYYRFGILELLGASGETLEIAARFLAITTPSVPIMVLGMIGSSTLRAEGDALRAMNVTLSAGFVAMIVDPLLIYSAGLGVDGAAIGVVVSRISSVLIALYYVVHVKKLAARVTVQDIKMAARPFFLIALPAVITQISSPFGNYIATAVVSQHGEAAVAGWAVVGRITVVAFGGVFALSGAIGGIIGQNYGAGQFDRVKSGYRDALIFSSIYVVTVWAILALCTPAIISAFKMTDEAAEIIRAFSYIAAGSFVFTGAIFVSNAAFNNLGKPIYSTIVNWVRDGVFMWPCCFLGSLWALGPGVIYGQAAAGILIGFISVILGWRYILTVENESR